MPAILTDFGLSRLIETGSRLTHTGQAVGTPAYMSPEQARGELSALTPATDVWGVGCVLYELLAGRPPFEGSSTAAVVGQVLLAEPPRIRSLRLDVPEGVERILRACLAKAAPARYGDAAALREDLDRVLRGAAPRAPRARRGWVRLVAIGALVVVAIGVAAWPRPTVSVSPEAARLVAQAQGLRTTDPRRAAELLEQALASAPERGDLRVLRGLLLWAINDDAGARDEWRRVVGEPAPPGDPGAPTARNGRVDSPDATAARLYLALEAFYRLDSAEAGVRLAAVAHAPGAEGQLARGAQAAQRRDWGAARDALRGQACWEAALLRGYVEGWDPAGDRVAAVREYGEALTDGIPFAWALGNRGVLRRAAGDLPGALADFDAALAIDPRNAKALYNRGLARQHSGELHGAILDYDAALAVDPRYTNARFARGLAQQASGDVPGAIESFDAVLALDPSHARAFGNRGSARLAAGDLAGAIADFGAAVALDPQYAAAFNNRGLARQAAGDSPGAIVDFDAALRVDPRYAEAYYNRGVVRTEGGNLEGAVADYEAVLQLEPANTKALANLGGARHALRRWGAAAEALREFLRLAPKDPVAGRVRRILAECEEKARAAAGG